MLSMRWLPSVLWRCWLGGRKGIRPVKKTEWWGPGVVICLKRGADLHMAQLMPLPLTVCRFSKIQIGFAYLVPAHLGSPGQRAFKRVYVCVCVCMCASKHKISVTVNIEQRCSGTLNSQQLVHCLSIFDIAVYCCVIG